MDRLFRVLVVLIFVIIIYGVTGSVFDKTDVNGIYAVNLPRVGYVLGLDSDYIYSQTDTDGVISNGDAIYGEPDDIIAYDPDTVSSEDADQAVAAPVKVRREKPLIVIDAGHGGIDSGTFYGNILEKDINLDIALRLDKLLKSAGVETYMIRTSDKAVHVTKRPVIANSLNATLFISIHNNYLPESSSYSGTETLYYPVKETKSGEFNAKRLATLVQKSLVSKLGTKNRGIVPRSKLVVLKQTAMPAVIAEVGYISNATDRKNLTSSAFKQKAAEGLRDAILRAIKEIY